MAKSNVASKSVLRYSVSLVRQGKHIFYTLTMPSDVLAKTCFASRRHEDAKAGFQRLLDKKRAAEIAQYIDTGLGTIPNSIVLSAQPEAELRVVGGGKTIEFKNTSKAFLILDGQHRVYGFSLANASLRVPVVIYNGLTRRDETRLFIDINTKQRPVPNELLLDIKQLADYESEPEQKLRELFDLFNSSTDSPLLGLMNPAARDSKKISRVTFNTAMKPIVSSLKDRDAQTIFQALNPYLRSFIESMRLKGTDSTITNSTVFRAAMLLFPEIAQRVKDRHGPDYTQGNFTEIIDPMFLRLRTGHFTKAGNSVKELRDVFLKAVRTDFSL